MCVQRMERLGIYKKLMYGKCLDMKVQQKYKRTFVVGSYSRSRE